MLPPDATCSHSSRSPSAPERVADGRSVSSPRENGHGSRVYSASGRGGMGAASSRSAVPLSRFPEPPGEAPRVGPCHVAHGAAPRCACIRRARRGRRHGHSSRAVPLSRPEPQERVPRFCFCARAHRSGTALGEFVVSAGGAEASTALFERRRPAHAGSEPQERGCREWLRSAHWRQCVRACIRRRAARQASTAYSSRPASRYRVIRASRASCRMCSESEPMWQRNALARAFRRGPGVGVRQPLRSRRRPALALRPSLRDARWPRLFCVIAIGAAHVRSFARVIRARAVR